MRAHIYKIIFNLFYSICLLIINELSYQRDERFDKEKSKIESLLLYYRAY